MIYFFINALNASAVLLLLYVLFCGKMFLRKIKTGELWRHFTVTADISQQKNTLPIYTCMITRLDF